VISPGGGLQIEGRPLNITGAYSSPLDVSIIAGEAGGAIMSFRYPGTGIAILTGFNVQAITTATFGTPQRILFIINRYNNWTVADSGGNGLYEVAKRNTYPAATAVTLVSNNATLTKGTSTLVGNIAVFAVYASATNSLNFIPQNIFELVGAGNHPFFFAQNEGFRLELAGAVTGASGTLSLTGNFHWFEATTW
jgi:hypothetical protein